MIEGIDFTVDASRAACRQTVNGVSTRPNLIVRGSRAVYSVASKSRANCVPLDVFVVRSSRTLAQSWQWEHRQLREVPTTSWSRVQLPECLIVVAEREPRSYARLQAYRADRPFPGLTGARCPVDGFGTGSTCSRPAGICAAETGGNRCRVPVAAISTGRERAPG